MEGGAGLRPGMNDFLASVKKAASSKNLCWKLVLCGGRTAARDAFFNSLETAREFCNILLVDAESPVADVSLPIDHLRVQDQWRFDNVKNESIHLMIQTMETWIVCDVQALFYGQGFAAGALPRSQNPEQVAKADVADALDRAAANTKKGKYHKIRHAGPLLGKIDAELVRKRCPSCERMFKTLLDLVITA
jgi:hypothetical protein